MATPPARTDLADTYPNPSNSQYRTGIGKMWDVLFAPIGGLLGTAGTPAGARDALGIGSSFSNRNILVNGNFGFNQRGYVSGAAAPVANYFTLDHWRLLVSGQSMSFGAAAPDRVVTVPAGGIEQPIDGREIGGGTYVLSWVGAATAQVNGAPVANGGTVSLPANTNAALRFFGGTVSYAQLELGTIPTVFERRPYPLELIRCQRFLEVWPAGALDMIDNNAVAGQNNSYSVPMKVQKYSAPVFVDTTWTLSNVGSIGPGTSFDAHVTLNVVNNAAGQWRITNSSPARLFGEMP